MINGAGLCGESHLFLEWPPEESLHIGGLIFLVVEPRQRDEIGGRIKGTNAPNPRFAFKHSHKSRKVASGGFSTHSNL